MKFEIEVPEELAAKIRAGMKLYETPEDIIVDVARQGVISIFESDEVGDVVHLHNWCSFNDRDEAKRVAHNIVGAIGGTLDYWNIHKLQFKENGEFVEESIKKLLTICERVSP